MSLFGRILVGLCWSLPFACYAIRRWRVRVYLTHLPAAHSRLVYEGKPVGASEAKDSSRRASS